MIGAPILDDVGPARAQPREDLVERSAGRRKPVRGVVDDEIDRLVAEVAVESLTDDRTICLIDAEVHVDNIRQGTVPDEVVQRQHRARLELEGDQLPRPSGRGEEGHAPTLGDAELDDDPTAELLASIEERRDCPRVLQEVEALRGGPGLVVAHEGDALDLETGLALCDVERAATERRAQERQVVGKVAVTSPGQAVLRSCRDQASWSARSTTNDTPERWTSLYRSKCHWGRAAANSWNAARSPDTCVGDQQK